jgi:hypothetical protein
MMELENANHASVPGVDLFPVSAVKIQVERASLHSNSPTYVPRGRLGGYSPPPFPRSPACRPQGNVTPL